MSDFDQRQSPAADDDNLAQILQATTPQPDNAFRDNLEAHLMAHLTAKHQDQGDQQPMKLFHSEKAKRQTKQARIPLTLAAAILAIVLIGGFILLLPSADDRNLIQISYDCDYDGQTQTYVVRPGDTIFSLSRSFGVSVAEIRAANCTDALNQLPERVPIRIPITEEQQPVQIITVTPQSATLEARATSVAAGQVSNPRKVVVAAVDIAYGETITDDMLSTDSRTSDTIDAVFPFCCENYIIGRAASEPISAGNIVEERMLSDFVVNNTSAYCDNPDALDCLNGRYERVTITLHIPYRYVLGFEENRRLDVLIISVPSEDNTEADIQTVASDVVLLAAQEEGANIKITLSVKPVDAPSLVDIAESNTPLMLVPHAP